MKPKNSKWIVLVIIIVVIVAGILGYVLFSQKTSTKTTPTATATPTSTTPSETYGMSQYVDPAYGFSFWYPSALQITTTTTNNSSDFPGGVAVETLQVGPAGGIAIYVVNSPTNNITDEPANHASPIAQTQYFYNSTSGQWMVDYPQGTDSGDSAATTTANISKTTISGLVMLPSGRRFDTTIIPLSTTQFLVIGDGGGSSFTPQLAETVTQAGATVGSSAQETALQTEATAYGPTTIIASSTSDTSNVQQLNMPGSVSLRQGDIAEIRNEGFYFTLKYLSSSAAAIQITPVGCWNSFPSDPAPKIHCMIALVPIPLQTLSVGQMYHAANYGITLMQISNAVATFSVDTSSTVQ